MSFVIVPNYVSEAINKAIDAEFHAIPRDSIMNPEERARIFETLLNYFDEHGEIPEFKLTLKAV